MAKRQPTREKLLDVAFEEVYKYGYSATSIDAILKIACVPKGSMYHHFKSKKALVLAMVEERLYPKMDAFFTYERKENATVTQSLKETFTHIAYNKMLVTYGCPLYRLMVELSPVDTEFDTLLSTKAKQMQSGIAILLQSGIDEGEFTQNLKAEEMAQFIVSSVWGALSLSPTLSSKKAFVKHAKVLLELLETHKTS